MTELVRTAEKIATLELTKTGAELAASEDYAALQTRKAELEEELQSQLEEQGDDFFKKVIQGPRHNNPR